MIPFLARAGAAVRVRRETRRSTRTLKCYDLVWYKLDGDEKKYGEDSKTPHDRNGRRLVLEDVVSSLGNIGPESRDFEIRTWRGKPTRPGRQPTLYYAITHMGVTVTRKNSEAYARMAIPCFEQKERASDPGDSFVMMGDDFAGFWKAFLEADALAPAQTHRTPCNTQNVARQPRDMRPTLRVSNGHEGDPCHAHAPDGVGGLLGYAPVCNSPGRESPRPGDWTRVPATPPHKNSLNTGQHSAANTQREALGSLASGAVPAEFVLGNPPGSCQRPNNVLSYHIVTATTQTYAMLHDKSHNLAGPQQEMDCLLATLGRDANGCCLDLFMSTSTDDVCSDDGPFPTFWTPV